MPCYYCGLPYATRDHIPPLSEVDFLIKHKIISPTELITIPSCQQCNQWLGTIILHTPEERRAIIKVKLRDQMKIISDTKWSSDEMEELGPRLRREVEGQQNYAELLQYRFIFKTSLSHISDDSTLEQIRKVYDSSGKFIKYFTRKCKVCNTDFDTSMPQKILCSKLCQSIRAKSRYKYTKSMGQDKKCIVCGSKFIASHPLTLTCSKSCSIAHHKEKSDNRNIRR
jgi:hypothetical protein